MNYLCIDAGTTCTKAQVFDDKGEILFYESRNCPLKQIYGESYADVEKIVATVKELIALAARGAKIDAIAVSTFGESFVTLDASGEILTYPMLYTDCRGEKEAEKLKNEFGNEYFFEKFGVCPHAMYSVSKLLWIKNNLPQKYEKIDKLLLMCDYIGYVLTGKRVIDYSLAARTGIFDVENKRFDLEFCKKLNINPKIFSKPMPLGTIVGKIKPSLCKELGLSEDCALVLGSHDQVCATIGAGVISAGESADGMGTVECVTSVFKGRPQNVKMGDCGYPVVPFINGLYCTYILNATSNSIMNWYRGEILHGYKGEVENAFEYLEKGGENPTDILVLPYFSGSANPYNDVKAKGAIVNLTLNATDGDIYRAVMESTSYEMKFNFSVVKEFGIEIKSVVATGGGANSEMWVQIKSDIFGKSVKTLRSSEGGLCGLAMICSVALKNSPDYFKARDVFVKYKREFTPAPTYKRTYDEKFEKYKKLYKNLKELF